MELTDWRGIARESAKPNYTAQLRWVYTGSSYHRPSVSPLTAVTIGIPPTRLTTTGSVTIAKGQPTKVVARLVDAQSGNDLAGLAFALYARAASSKPWTKIKTLTTSATGRVSQLLRPNYSTQLQWRYAGSSVDATSSSPIITVT
jgi:hypothetical protein